ncbi:MAG: phosphatase PAP2 family protein [Hydrogenophaga sp.]|uniref:phosphatase PAP2 family protein n=1 Tax=Hydrogenophaga sp. TaxID=1904254 RepID=UPI001D708416|nr:phosphatase PAP2 family protein [Hydrogenophaga sp.]MBX3609884.1 phosphatase PAP2 family protein [Hydrogenophaga sp.]
MNAPFKPLAVFRPTTLEWWTVTLLTFYVLVMWDFSGLDLAVMQHIGTAHGFPERDNFWLSTVGHIWARNAGTVLLIGVWIAVWRPIAGWRRFERRERLTMAVATTVALLAVNVIKRHSGTSCPWDLDQFGGTAHWVSHWSWWVAGDGGPGGCFPGGHASTALAFIGLAWPGLSTPEDSARWRFGQWALWLSLAGGAVLGAVQLWRGAHPPSHSVWTAWICWTASGVVFGLCRRWRARGLLARAAHLSEGP